MRICLTAFVLLMSSSLLQAGDWPQRRGPNFNGSTDETGLPVQWTTTENVVWSADLPGAAASTPVVVGEHVFLSGVDAAKDTLVAMAFSRQDGKLLWKHDVAKGTARDYRSNFASGSPVTDGNLVVFFFGSGPLVCFDATGERKWARNIEEDYGPFAFQWTFSSSPLLLGDKLYVQVLQRDVPAGPYGLVGQMNESYLLAIAPETGKTLWRHVRPSKAVAESREAFSTPIPFTIDGQQQILIAGGDALTGHDPETGEELWRWGTWNPQRIGHWRHVTSPVAGGDVILVCAPKRDPIYAIKTGLEGVHEDQAVAWTTENTREITSDVPTPAFYDGDFFILSDVRRSLSRVDPRTGKAKWTTTTPGRSKYEASPLAADGKIYLVNFNGEVSVVDAKSGEMLNTIPMDNPQNGEVVRASIVAAHGQLFIRTTRKLYCVARIQ